jgi:hypothetical protein
MMVIEIPGSPQRFNVSVSELKERLAILRNDWSGIEVYVNETMHSPFNVLIEQVKREIRNCGFVLDEEPNSCSVETVGDSRVSMWILYCSPKVLVVIHFNDEGITYSDGSSDVRTTLAGIQVMELE